MELESKFQKKLLLKLRLVPNSYWFVKEAASIRGISDIIGLVNGRFVALEVKRSEAEARKRTGRIVLQLHFLSHIQKAKGLGLLVHPGNLPSVLERIEKLNFD